MIHNPMSGDDISFPVNPSKPTALPPHILAVYNTVKDNLEIVGTETDAIIDALIEEVNTALDGVEQDTLVIISGIIGDVDIALKSVEDDTERKLTAVINSVYKALAVAENDLVENGIGVPVATHDMRADLDSGDLDWIAHRIAGNSQPVTPIMSPDTGDDTIHQCDTCAGDTVLARAPFDTSTVLQEPGLIEPLPIPPLPSPNGTPAPVPPVPPAMIDCRNTPPLPPGAIATYYMGPLGCMEVLEITPIGIVSVTDLDKYWQNPGWMVSVGTITWHGERPAQCLGGCGTSPPPPSPPVVPPPPPDPFTCPPACPIPVTVEVKYPPVPPPPPPATPGVLSGIPVIPGSGSFWTRPDVCDLAVRGLTAPVPSDPAAPPLDTKDSKSVFTKVTELMLPTLKPTRMVFDWAKGGFSDTDLKDIFASELTEFGKAASSLGPTASVIAGSLGLSVPNMPAAITIGSRIALAQKAEANSGFPVMYLAQNDWYLYQFANPQYLPTQSELNQAYSRNVIQSEQWRCLTMALGNQPEGMAWVIDAQQVRPIPSDIIGLYNRGIINRDKFYTMMREVGVLNQINSDYFYDLSKYVPPPTDLVRYMVRDVTDRTVVDQYGLDKDFDTKFYGVPGTPEYGKLPAWAQAQGISVDTFLYDWRAHWQMPSNTTLYEAQSRFRPDRPEYLQYVEKLNEWIASGKLGLEPIAPPVMYPADVQRALEVNDLMPKFVPITMGLAYEPITRTDAVRAYEIGVFNDDQLYHAMRDRRYNDHDAKTLLDFYKQQKLRRVSNATGVWSIRKIVAAYKNGSLTYDESFALLTPLMSSVQQRQQALEGANTEVKADTKLKWIRLYRRAYFTGEQTKEGTRTDLVNIGMDLTRVEDLLEQWTSEKMGRYREATTKQLMEWAINNLISLADLHKRLRTLGYSEIDAERIEYTAAYRQDKIARAEMDKIVRDQEKRFKDKQQAAKATYDELEKRRKELEKERKRIQDEMDKRKPPTP